MISSQLKRQDGASGNSPGPCIQRHATLRLATLKNAIYESSATRRGRGWAEGHTRSERLSIVLGHVPESHPAVICHFGVPLPLPRRGRGDRLFFPWDIPGNLYDRLPQGGESAGKMGAGRRFRD